jgi:hypothetical protein
MQLFPLEVVESWHSAVNACDVEQLCALASRDVEVVGPRGIGRGHDVLRQWFRRGGLTAEPLRYFCGSRGQVVVEQRGRWFSPEAVTVEDSGRWFIPDTTSERIVATAFSVLAGRVVRYQRFDRLGDALAATSLSDDDEVLGRC